jgi:hypothetical protein
MDMPTVDKAQEGQAPSAEQATISWAGGQIMVDMGQGPEPVDDIGAALQAVLEAYQRAGESEPGEAGYNAAFSQDGQASKSKMMREPTAGDSAAAGRY